MKNRTINKFSIENSRKNIENEISIIFEKNDDRNKIFVSIRNLVNHAEKIIVHQHFPKININNKRIDFLINCIKDIGIYDSFIKFLYESKGDGDIDAHDILDIEKEIKLQAFKIDLVSFLKVFYLNELNNEIPEILIRWKENLNLETSNTNAIKEENIENLKQTTKNNLLGIDEKLNTNYLNGQSIFRTEKINFSGKVITIENGVYKGAKGIRGNFAEKPYGAPINSVGFYVNDLIKDHIGLASIIKDTVYAWSGDLLRQLKYTHVKDFEVNGIKILNYYYDDEDEYTKEFDEEYLRKSVIHFLISKVLGTAIEKVLKEKTGEKYEFIMEHIKFEELKGMRDLRAYQIKQIKPLKNTFWGLLKDENQIEINRLHVDLTKFEREWFLQLEKLRKYGSLDLRAIL